MDEDDVCHLTTVTAMGEFFPVSSCLFSDAPVPTSYANANTAQIPKAINGILIFIAISPLRLCWFAA